MTKPGSHARRPAVPAAPLRRVAAVSIALVLAPAAQALAQAGAAGTGRPRAEGGGFSVFLGAFAGYDSNALRAEPAGEDGDGLTELLGGLTYAYRKSRKALELRYQIRYGRYGELSQCDYDETEALLTARVATRKVLYRLRLEHALLAEPEDIEIAENLQRTRTLLLPEADLSFGRMQLGLGYSVRSFRYEDLAFGYLDLSKDDSALRTELRWRAEEAQSQQAFVHLRLGRTDYAGDVPSDFDQTRLYFGWRSEAEGKSGIELAAGTDTIDSSRVSSETSTFSLVRYRAGLPGQGKRSALEVAYARGAEAAATADHKVVSTILGRYIHGAASRFSWSVGLRSEKAEFVKPDPGTAETLFRFSLEAALQLEFGSLVGSRGRWYASLGYEMRRGEAPQDKYYRMRALTGIAFVY